MEQWDIGSWECTSFVHSIFVQLWMEWLKKHKYFYHNWEHFEKAAMSRRDVAVLALYCPETKQHQSCFQAYDNTSFYLQKAERSTAGGQSDRNSVHSEVQGLHTFLCGGEQTLLGVMVSRKWARSCHQQNIGNQTPRWDNRPQHPPSTWLHSRNECSYLWQKNAFGVTPFRVGQKHCEQTMFF